MKKIYRFSAVWCGPCKALERTLEDVESPFLIEEIDIDTNPDLAKEFNIRGVPTLVMIEDDVEIKRKAGLMNRQDFLQWVNS